MPAYPNATLYARHDHALLLQIYLEGPARLRQSLAGCSEADLKARPLPGKWSIQEIILHVVDAETLGATRIRQIFTQRHRPLAFYDPSVWADELHYQDADAATLENSLRLFELLRELTAPIFQRATPADWQKAGLHPERGEITLRQALELYADHSERHLGQILERRQLLGCPLDLPLLLPERLY
ncbi:DinB family protein [Hymenobacter terrenus]|uniref:DinB family protein n=1 Tax=Hymenobacter terrenus TaxID=1629124 RepID=UPI00061964E6|nr:DinB family protein [Hymenobacter terrenus]